MHAWIDEEPTGLKEHPISPSKGHQIKLSGSLTPTTYHHLPELGPKKQIVSWS